MKEYYLMDLDTGEQFSFDKMFDVEEFLADQKRILGHALITGRTYIARARTDTTFLS